MMVGALVANAGAQAPGAGAPPGGGPPSNAGAAAVKKDNTPVPKSGVVSISFLGNKKLTSEQLQKVVDGTQLKLGGPVGFQVISSAMKALVAFYKEKGVGLSISPDIISDPKGIDFVQFIIDENHDYGDVGGLVSSGGPQAFCKAPAPPAAGAGAAPGGAPGGGAPGGASAPGGGAPPAAAAAKKDNTPIPASGVVSISFVGNKKFSSEQLQKVVDGTPLKVGNPVNHSVILPAMKALVAFYKENGAGLSISPDIIEDPKGIAAVQFIIDENASKGDIGGFVSSGGPHIFCE
jgi:hypothetical protein